MAKYKEAAEFGKVQADLQRRYEYYLQTLAAENRQWRNRYGEIVDTIIDDLSAAEKKTLYGISSPMDITEMGRAEQELLIAILWEMALHQAKPKDEGSKFLQETFLRSVQLHLGIMEIQSDPTTLISEIKNIDSKRDETAILQVVLEYLFLENNDHSYTQRHNSILRSFECAGKNMTSLLALQERIDKYVSGAGVIGLATKYSYKVADTQEEELIPATYRIEIRYDKSDLEAVKLLKASLENKKNICSLQEIIKGKNVQSPEQGYVISFGDNEATQDALSYGKQETLFDAYGCKIISPVGSNTYVLTYDSEFSNYNREEFLNFYKKTCLATEQVQKSNAKTLAEKRDSKKPRRWRVWNFISDVPEMITDKLDVKEEDGIGISLLKVLGMIASLPVSLAAFAVSFVVAIPEELVQDRIEKLQDSNFDHQFVGSAQSDILVVKMSEIIWDMQNKNSRRSI